MLLNKTYFQFIIYKIENEIWITHGILSHGPNFIRNSNFRRVQSEILTRVDLYLEAGVAFSNLWLTLHCCIDVYWCYNCFRWLHYFLVWFWSQNVGLNQFSNPFHCLKIACFGFVVLWKKEANALSCIHESSQILVITPKTSKIEWLSSTILRTTMMITKY